MDSGIFRVLGDFVGDRVGCRTAVGGLASRPGAAGTVRALEQDSTTAQVTAMSADPLNGVSGSCTPLGGPQRWDRSGGRPAPTLGPPQPTSGASGTFLTAVSTWAVSMTNTAFDGAATLDRSSRRFRLVRRARPTVKIVGNGCCSESCVPAPHRRRPSAYGIGRRPGAVQSWPGRAVGPVLRNQDARGRCCSRSAASPVCEHVLYGRSRLHTPVGERGRRLSDTLCGTRLWTSHTRYKLTFGVVGCTHTARRRPRP
jgi:hypothetical protein